MKPQQSVFNMLAKAAAKQQEPIRVEFDAVSDSNKYLQKSKAYAAQLEKLNKQISDAEAEARKILNKADAISAQAKKVNAEYDKMASEHSAFYSKITQQAKQMGLDIKKTELFTTNEQVMKIYFDAAGAFSIDWNVLLKSDL